MHDFFSYTCMVDSTTAVVSLWVSHTLQQWCVSQQLADHGDKWYACSHAGGWHVIPGPVLSPARVTAVLQAASPAA
jgi:hypothetical protein